MKIKDLFLLTNKLEYEKTFYSDTLGFKIIDESMDSFTLKIGWSKLTFIKSNKAYKYHYCFLIPSNKLESAMQWMEKRTNVIDIENGRKTQHFESWNAESFYFYDASGNIAEFIVRYDLENSINNAFSINDIICINEIGLPSVSVKETNIFLEKELNSHFWKGDKINFGTNGTQEGLFLLPNYKTKTKWFPTDLKIEPAPFDALIENNNTLYLFKFSNDVIKVKKKQSS